VLRFYIGQKWTDINGNLYGEIVAIEDAGRRGTVLITDAEGKFVSGFKGLASEFQDPGRWQPVAN
jgi:hypothetical protein